MSDTLEIMPVQELVSTVEMLYLENLLHDDLTISEIIALHTIASLKNPTIVEFANTIKISQSNATYVIHKLVRKGYITKVPSSSDGRVFLLSVTDLYEEQLNFFKNRLAEPVHQIMASLSTSQQNVVEKFCAALNDALQHE